MKAKPLNLLQIFLWSLFIGSYIYLFYFYVIEHSAGTVLAPSGQEVVSAKSTEEVIRVIDGDTFEINGGIKVRLIGVDTPEMKNKNKTVDCFAQEAKQKQYNFRSLCILGGKVIKKGYLTTKMTIGESASTPGEFNPATRRPAHRQEEPEREGNCDFDIRVMLGIY